MTWDCLFVGKVIYATLAGMSGISTRIYPMRVPQETDLSTYSAISYYVIETTPETVKDSRSLVDTLRIQVSIFATSYSLANTIAQLVRDELDGLTGEVAGCSVDSMYLTNEIDLFEDETRTYHRAQEYNVRIKNGASVNQNEMVISQLSLTSDYTWTGAIPAGFLLEYVVFDETAGRSPQLSAGTSAGVNNIFSSEALTSGALTVISINKTFSKTSATTIYLNHAGDGDTWDGATVNVYAALRKYV